MEPNLIGVRPLSVGQYNKVSFRAFQADLSYPEKVRQVVALQRRMAPVCASRGRSVTPWTLAEE